MGQTESSYRKLGRNIRTNKVVKSSVNKETTDEDKNKNFPLSFTWKPNMSQMLLGPNNNIELDSLPGWFHGWTSRAEVIFDKQELSIIILIKHLIFY